MLLACASGASTTPAAPVEARQTEQGHLLLFPVGDAASLLGRPVHPTEGGAWTIGDGRLPGCEVSVAERPARFEAQRRVTLRSLVAASAGFSRLLGFAATHGTEIESVVLAKNSTILTADLRGECGPLVVDQVFVGSGRRRLVRGRETSGAATVAAIDVAGAAADSESIVDSVEWGDEQAWAFTFRERAAVEALSLEIVVPPRLAEGELVSVRFQTTRPAFLVVYFIDEAGDATLLWPSDEEPAPRAEPGRPAVLPSEREVAEGIRLRAALAAPGRPTRETLVAYALAERADFDALQPRGADRVKGADLAAALTLKLQAIPMSRWARGVAGYVIEPRR